MKRFLFKILCGALALVMLLSLVACGDSTKSWKAGNLTNGGAVVSNGGFVAETENYLYYINGIGTSTEDNAFGAPLKGALMAVDKADLTKTEVVVPKLFVATDYKSGFFIDGGYVYYGTPSTEKNSEGHVASGEMMFTRTKLDGSGTTEKFFALSSLSAEYRFVKNGDNVCVVYYDSVDTALECYSFSDKTTTVIAKTDAKTEGSVSLETYKFLNGNSDAVVVYTVTLYTEEYDAVKAEKDDYTRPTENFNKVYAYKVGDAVDETTGLAGTLVLDGAHGEGDLDDGKYAFSFVNDSYVFFTEAVGAKTTTYVDEISAFVKPVAEKKELKNIVKNTDFATEANVITSISIIEDNDANKDKSSTSKVYTIDTGKLYEVDLFAEGKNNQKVCVAIGEGLTTLLTVKDGFVYYYNASNQICRMELKKDSLSEVADEIRVSLDTANSSWYKPEFIKVGEKEYLFYLDNSSLGASYVKYVDINAKVIDEDTDNDDKADLFYLDKAEIKLMGIMTDADSASIITAEIDAISSKLDNGNLKFEEVEGKLTVKAVTDAKAKYDGATEEVKALVSETSLTTLNNYLKAIEIVNLYDKLEGIENFTDATKAESYKAAYLEIKSAVEEFKASAVVTAVDGYIPNNYKVFYQKAVELFEKTDK